MLLSGEHGVHDWAERIVRVWLGKDEPFRGDLSRAVDFQLIDPFGPASLIKISAITLTPKVSAEPGQGSDDDAPESEGKADPNEFQGIPVTRFFITRPLMMPTKVVWFRDADRLNAAASNALLKTLEELPDYARVVLSTKNPSAVLPTIRSRCIVVSCPGEVVGAELSRWSDLAATQAEAEMLEAHSQLYLQLPKFCEILRQAPPMAAIRLAEEFENLAKQVAEATGRKARDGQTHLLELLGRQLVANGSDPEILAEISRAAKLINGNVTGRMVLDALFGTILVQYREQFADRSS